MGKLIAALSSVALILVLVGALNWGLIAVFDFNVVTTLFGSGIVTKVIYVLVGLSAIAVGYKSYCK